VEAWFSRLRHYFYNSNLLYCLRIFIALVGVTLGPWSIHQPILTIPLTLGVVAAALTDLDDRLTGRLRNLLITLFCFLVATVSIELLMPYPWLFICGLFLSTGGFIMLGALGQRYATIAFGALLIAIYTMLGSSMYDIWYIQPILLLAGAIWYNLITLLGHIFLPIRPLQDNVSQCYFQLANYLDTKATLFDPDEEDEFKQQSINVAISNSKLVTILNQTKASLLTRLKSDRGQKSTRQLLHYYFIAQDIHEQISSSHVKYQSLSEQFRYSDVLFRFQRLLVLQAQACRKVAYSIRYKESYQHDAYFERTFIHLENTLERLNQYGQEKANLLPPLKLLLKNLASVDAQLAGLNAEQADIERVAQDNNLSDDYANGIKASWLRIYHQLTPKSSLFRHALRMSLVLCLGYAIIKVADLDRGYWILLTSLFVCQPNYSATKSRLTLRIVGTLTGVALGIPILYFIPSVEGQLILIVISGVLFFAFRSVRYAQATLFITLLVLLCFNLLGQGFEIIVPRIIDTIIGCAIAWAAVSFIWPDWHFRQLPVIVSKTISANCHYLDAIVTQYKQGKNNDLNYRIARRNAHNFDAELTSIVSGLSAEPKKDPQQIELGFRFLYLSHSLLSYISALGAHRDKITHHEILQILDNTAAYLTNTISLIPSEAPESSLLTEGQIEKNINDLSSPIDVKEQLVLQQVKLILALIPELISIRRQILSEGNSKSVAA
jgi:uncharacterized membrane protein (TIGR01666 family)